MMKGMIRIKEINCGRKESLQILSEHRTRHSWPGGNMQLSVWQLIYRSPNAIFFFFKKQTSYVPRWHGYERAQRQQRRGLSRTARTTWAARFVKKPDYQPFQSLSLFRCYFSNLTTVLWAFRSVHDCTFNPKWIKACVFNSRSTFSDSLAGGERETYCNCKLQEVNAVFPCGSYIILLTLSVKYVVTW